MVRLISAYIFILFVEQKNVRSSFAFLFFFSISVYIFHTSPSSWFVAKSVCESKGYKLAEFDSQAKRLVVPQLMINIR